MERNRKGLLRRLIALGLTVFMTVPVLAAGNVPEVPASYKNPFPDVKTGTWYYPYVATLNSKKVVVGCDDGKFHPNDQTTVGQALIMVLKASGLPAQPPVAKGHYASGYAQYAIRKGWITSTECKNLNAPINRLAVAKLTAKVLGISASSGSSPFVDVTNGVTTALYEKGIMIGSLNEKGQYVFKPNSYLSRAELCVITWQVSQKTTRIYYNSDVLTALPNVPRCQWERSLFQKDSNGYMHYGDSAVETKLGIDVSSYQGTVDWNAVAKAGMKFAIIRTGGRYYSSGAMFEDTCFRKNLEGATKAGLSVGVYFFSQAISAEEGKAEAEFVLNQLGGAALDGPVVFDWEIPSDSARTNSVDKTHATDAAVAFCKRIEQAGYQPTVYLNLYFGYVKFDLSRLAGYSTWLAQYADEPTYYYAYNMWQYSSKGSVPGIKGDVDLDIYLSGT